MKMDQDVDELILYYELMIPIYQNWYLLSEQSAKEMIGNEIKHSDTIYAVNGTTVLTDELRYAFFEHIAFNKIATPDLSRMAEEESYKLLTYFYKERTKHWENNLTPINKQYAKEYALFDVKQLTRNPYPKKHTVETGYIYLALLDENAKDAFMNEH